MRTHHSHLRVAPVALVTILGMTLVEAQAQYYPPRPPMSYGGYGGGYGYQSMNRYGGGYGYQSQNRYGNKSGGYGDAAPVYVVAPPAQYGQDQQAATAVGLALSAAGVPNDGGRLRWPTVLRLVGPPDGDRLRGQAESACQAAALRAPQGQAEAGDGRALAEATEGLRAHVRRLRDRVTLPREAYAEAEAFLDTLEAAPEALARAGGYNSPQLRAGEGDAPSRQEVEVAMMDTYFEPRVVVVPAGSTVRWANRGGHNHTATSDAGDWGSGEVGPGKSFTRVFDKPGSFPYHCDVHPGRMRGVILVK